MDTPLILQCSPRPRGNSAYAAKLIQDILEQETPLLASKTSRSLNLYDYSISPCTGCDICAIPKSHTSFFLGCPLAPKDDSEALFKEILTASTLYLVSPIYHYHLPAQAKAVLDRLQPFYWMQMNKVPFPAGHQQHRYYPLFIAGQERGQKLFEGSRLTLRYSFEAAGFTSDSYLGLRGLDPQDALKSSPQAQELLREFILRTLRPQGELLLHEEGQ